MTAILSSLARAIRRRHVYAEIRAIRRAQTSRNVRGG
jgi:hypothetical protein